jgi:hypothetical protein
MTILCVGHLGAHMSCECVRPTGGDGPSLLGGGTRMKTGRPGQKPIWLGNRHSGGRPKLRADLCSQERINRRKGKASRTGAKKNTKARRALLRKEQRQLHNSVQVTDSKPDTENEAITAESDKNMQLENEVTAKSEIKLRE